MVSIYVVWRVSAKSEKIIILINHNRSVQPVQLSWSAYEHLGRLAIGDELNHEPYGVAVLTHTV